MSEKLPWNREASICNKNRGEQALRQGVDSAGRSFNEKAAATRSKELCGTCPHLHSCVEIIFTPQGNAGAREAIGLGYIAVVKINRIDTSLKPKVRGPKINTIVRKAKDSLPKSKKKR